MVKNITIKGVIGELGCKSLLRFDLLVSYRLVEHWQRMDISLMRILPGVDLDKINKASKCVQKGQKGKQNTLGIYYLEKFILEKFHWSR